MVISPQGVRGYTGVYANYNSGFTDQNQINYNVFKFENNIINTISLSLGLDVGASIDGYNMQITHKNPLWGYYIGLQTYGDISFSIGYSRPINHLYINTNHDVVNFALTLSV